MVMRTYICLICLLLSIVAGCASGYYATYSTDQYYPGEEQYGIPPSWYDNDPSMRQWYTPPYFDPHRPH